MSNSENTNALINATSKTIEQLINEGLAYWNNDNQEHRLTQQGCDALFEYVKAKRPAKYDCQEN